MSQPECRLCGSTRTEVSLSIPKAPRNIQSLLREEGLMRDRPIHLEVHTCKICGFVQIPPVLEEDYYDDYLMGTTHSAQMQSYQAAQAADFIKRFDLQGKRILEVGCGDGSYLDHLKAQGAQVHGIEPSQRFRKLAIGRGHPVEDGYVTANRRVCEVPFDAFVTRQVLEHVPDIHDYLRGLRLNVIDGGYGLVEVPSLEKAIADGRFFDFFTDHVNYFSLDTLALAMRQNGFRVIEASHGMFEEYNVVLVQAVSPPSLATLQRALSDLSDDLSRFLREKRQEGKKVCVWGAGGKGLSVLAATGVDSVDLLVDSDPFKHGLYTPVSHLRIEKPSAQNLSSMDFVVITAMAYRHEIERDLRSMHGFKGTVAVIGNRLEISNTSTFGTA